MSGKWYVIRTQPRAECLAANELTRDGFEIFSPMVKTPRVKTTQSLDTLFPGYLFLKCDTDADGWPSFRPAHRVIGWVRFGGDTPWLSDSVIRDLKDRIDTISNEGGLWQRFRAGEKVEVASASVEGLGEVVRDGRSAQARVEVLMRFMGRIVRAQVPRENLQPVNDRTDENHKRLRRTRGKGRKIGSYRPLAAVKAV